jgi:hypothetical protein
MVNLRISLLRKGLLFLKEWKWLNADFRAKSKNLKNHNSKLIQNQRAV